MKLISLYCASAMAALLLLGVNNCTNASAKSDTSVTNSQVVSDGGQKEAGDEWSENDFTYSLSNGEVTITGLATGVSKRENMNIPDEIRGSEVTEIGNNAFKDVGLSGSVQIPASVESIGDYAFSNNQIFSLDLPSNGKLTSIGVVAFAYNSLSGKLAIPDNLKTISGDAFRDNQLSSVTINSGSQLESIGSIAFANNNITAVELSPTQQITFGDVTFLNNRITIIKLDNVERIVGQDIFYGQNAEKSVPYSSPLPLSNVQPTITISNTDGQSTTVDKFDIENTSGATYDKGTFTDFTPNSKFSFHLRPTADTPETKLNTIIEQLGYTLDQTVNVGDEEATPPPGTGGGNGNGENSNGHGNSGNQNPSQELPTTPGNSSTNPISQPEAEVTVKPVSRRIPAYVYNKRTIRLHRNANLTSPVKTYRQTARRHAKTFKIIGTAKSTNGALRYRVKGGYITASKKHVANLYYQTHTKRIRVIADKGINQYKDAKLTKRAGHVKRGKVLRIKKLVKVGNVTRYQLTNGNYITGNKTMVMWR